MNPVDINAAMARSIKLIDAVQAETPVRYAGSLADRHGLVTRIAVCDCRNCQRFARCSSRVSADVVTDDGTTKDVRCARPGSFVIGAV